jgi:hypothetical protein
MALENQKEIEQALGLEEGKLSEYITSEENHTIDLTPLVIEKKAIYEERISNIKKEEFKHGQDKFFKTVRDEFGLEITGKTPESLVQGLKTYVETEKEKGGAEPEEKYKTLKTDFEKLQKNFTEKENEFTTFKTTIEKNNELNEIKSEFTKHIPSNTLVSKNTVFVEAKEKGYSFEKEDGKVVVKLNGEIQKDDKTLSPVSVESFVKDFVTPYIGKPEGGAGGGDDTPPGKAGSFEAFEKEAAKAGWNDSERNEVMMKRIKDGSLKL